MAQLPARHPEIHVKEDRMSAYPTLSHWATRGSVLAIASACALALPSAALATTGDDGHGNGNGRGHVEHGNGNGFGHDKDAKSNNGNKDKDKGKPGDKPGNGPKDKPCDGPDRDNGCGNDKNKDKDKPGKGPDKPCDGPDRDKGCGNDKPGHDDKGKGNDPAPTAGNTQTVVVQPASPTSSSPTFVVGSNNSRQCVSRRYLRLRLSKTYGAAKARVLLNGRKVRVKKTKRYGLTALIDLRKQVKGTYVVRIAVVTKRGRLVTATRRFRTCTPKGTPVSA
jgi:hypothetical protein